ncbi:MAG: response regulator transcription factor [Bacteroidia bacterium]
MKPRILLMEDEPDFRRMLAMNLELEGYTVSEAENGLEAIRLFESEHFDLCLLDVMVPHVSGLNVCERIRLHQEKIPVLFLSALNATQDRVNGLRRGADDYVAKPFHLEELYIKINRLIRKGYWLDEGMKSDVADSSVFRFGENQVDLSSYEARGIAGNFLLTRKEADLLRLFFEHPNEILSRERILHTVWGYNIFPSTRSIDNFVLFLRQKFEADSKNPQYFRAVRGVGYRFTPKGR